METKIIDLAINRQYLAGKWTYLEAIREIVQNCIDEGQYDIDVDKAGGTIYFTTHGKTIGIDKMALGTTTKTDAPELIGKYGEGLKLGMVALLREGHGVEIHNGEELWTPFIGRSDVFGCDTLQLRIEDDLTDQKTPDGVTIVASGFNPSELLGIAGTSLEMTRIIMGGGPEDTSETEYGTIIRDEPYKGRVFVGGLYVQTDANLGYGFDFKPAEVELDRDRSVINYYQLMALVAKALIDEGDPATIYASYKDNSLSDDITANLADASDSAKRGFFEKYLSAKKGTDGGIQEALTIEGTILVDKTVNEFLKSHAEAIGYTVAVEDDEDIRDLFNDFSDDTGKKKDLVEGLAGKTGAWLKIKNSGQEMLRYFNDSGYKEMLAIINHLVKGRVAKWIVGFLRTAALPLFSKYSFEGILPYIDESKVTGDPYALDFDLIAKEGKR